MKSIGNLNVVLKTLKGQAHKGEDGDLTVREALSTVIAASKAENIKQSMQLMKVHELLQKEEESIQIEDADYELIRNIADTAAQMWPAQIAAQLGQAFDS